MKEVRVRFAPSPTGPLHMGGVRTALFNYLFAKKHGGKFLLRIEDTDQTRFVPGAEEYIIKSLNWCGITIDEGQSVGGEYGPYRQSERKEIYLKYIDQLLKSGNAYFAFDSSEELDAKRSEFEAKKLTFSYDIKERMSMRNSLTLSEEETQKLIKDGAPYVIRFKMEENIEVSFDDIVRGNVKVNTNTLDDKILFKSDGLPTYHFANVVDDYLMKITHVIRGEEWLPSCPLHVQLYKALGWEADMPDFAHLPLLLKPSGKGKLSKRDGDKLGFPVFPLEWISPKGDKSMGYKEEGYFADSFVNILAFLGWNPGTEQEIFSMDELIQAFDLSRVSKAGARFDLDKAKWFNQNYLKQKPNNQLATEFNHLLEEKGINTDLDFVEKVVELVKERAVFVKDLWEQASFFFEAPESYDAKVIKKRWKENTPDSLAKIANILANTEDFTSENTGALVKSFIQDNELNMGQIMNCLRLVIVGEGKGPDMFDIITSIGKQESIDRINKGINSIKK